MPQALEGENDQALATDMSLEGLFGAKGKVALITGGGSGIGAMIATGLSRNGAKVYIASRKPTIEFASQLPNCTSVQCDVANSEQVDKLLQLIKENHGKLDILINNAGTNFSAPLGKYTSESFDKVMQVNVRSLFYMTQAALPLLVAAAKDNGPARVINIASINGLRAPTDMDTYAYSSSKAAVVMLSKHLAGKLGKKNITVNSICPGPFPSRMMRGTIKMVGEKNISKNTALGRLGEPQVCLQVVGF